MIDGSCVTEQVFGGLISSGRMPRTTAQSDAPTAVESVLKSFPYATFFVVIFVVVLKNEHAVALYDMAAENLGIGRMQLALLVVILAGIIFIFWKLLVTFLEGQKEAVKRELIKDVERLALIRLFGATGKECFNHGFQMFPTVCR